MKIKNLLLTFMLAAAVAVNVNAQAKTEPIVQDFESAVYPDGMQDWTYYCADDEPGYSYGSISSDYNHTLVGSQCFYFSGADESYGYLISPPLSFDGPVDISFFYSIYQGDPVSFEMGYSMSDIQGDEIDNTSFTWISIDIPETLDISQDQWVEYTGVLLSGVKRIAIALPSDELYLFVDDISLAESSACPTPSGLICMSSTTTTLGLSWDGNSDSYELRHKPGFRNTFEYGIEGWTTIDADGDDYNWTVGNDPEVGSHEGNYYISSESYHDDGTAEPDVLEPDNYLVSPLVPLGGSITFWAKGMDETYYQEHFGVAISTEGNQDHNDFVTIGEWTAMSSDWRKYTVDLSQYSGMGYVAIRHFNCTDMSAICIDDITIFTSPEWTTVSEIENTSYTLENLMFETNYAIQVKGNCGQNGYSDWSDEFYAMTSNADCRFITAGDWNVSTNWRNNVIPGADSDVVIAAAATIPAGYLASADNINLGFGSITIADGGQLKHNNAGLVVTAEKSIMGYGESVGGYYLIASPLADDFTPTADNGFLTGDYDLYRFNEAVGNEWENWEEQTGDHYQFDLENGKGYLYANSGNVTLSFTGAINPSNSPITVEDLGYTGTAMWKGWNLVGNPFMCDAYINREDFFVLNDSGSEVVAAESGATIAPLQGVFVKATSDSQSVTFSRERAQNNNGSGVLNVNVIRSEANVDVARVRFGEGQGLEKFQLNPSHTKVYFTQNGKNYAVVNANGIDDLPCNFKAEEDGTYTLSFTKEQVEFNYLHLIDNLTGADIDLLQQPEYTFQAKNDDYASRFRVVFVAKDTEGIAEDSETFAFNSYGSWIIVNEGLATLQLVDINGRMICNETIEGYTSMKFNVAPGVYVLRLVNGENVRVQKVVVR